MGIYSLKSCLINNYITKLTITGMKLYMISFLGNIFHMLRKNRKILFHNSLLNHLRINSAIVKRYKLGRSISL